MSNPPISRQDVERAAAQLKARVSSECWQKAIDTALVQLPLGRWAWYGTRLRVWSSRGQDKYWVTSSEVCDPCPSMRGGKSCYHRAMYALLVLAQDGTLPRWADRTPAAAALASKTARIKRKFPHTQLRAPQDLARWAVVDAVFG